MIPRVSRLRTLCGVFALALACAFALTLSGCSSLDAPQRVSDGVPAIEYSEPAQEWTEDQSVTELERDGRASDSLARSAVEQPSSSTLRFADVPAFSGESYVELKGGAPMFSEGDLAQPFGIEYYAPLDTLGRTTMAFAVVGPETQPNEKREQLKVKPSGWKQAFYPEIGLDHLYERSHLIAYMLTAENNNPQNLVTGTHYMNHDGMLDFEHAIDTYVDLSGHHVVMRVTPLYEGNELVCRGVQMEAYSLEDNGEGVSLNVFCYNVQPGVEINYATGESWLAG